MALLFLIFHSLCNVYRRKSVSVCYLKFPVVGVCGLNGVPVLSRVMPASSDETDPVPIPIQTAMGIIVLGTQEMIASV